jgi:hypothetical protein
MKRMKHTKRGENKNLFTLIPALDKRTHHIIRDMGERDRDDTHMWTKGEIHHADKAEQGKLTIKFR